MFITHLLNFLPQSEYKGAILAIKDELRRGEVEISDIKQSLKDKYQAMKHVKGWDEVVEFWGLPPLILFFNMSTGWLGRFVLSTECYRTRKLGYNNLNWPRCSACVTESLALTDGGFCQKQTLYISDYVTFVSLSCVF